MISEEYIYCSDPDVAVDREGNAIVVWNWIEDSGIQANRYDADAGEWEGVVQLSESYDDDYPKVALDLSGNTVVVWNHSSDGDVIYARRIEAGADWSASSFSEAEDISGGGNFEGSMHQIDAGLNGRFIVVWIDADELKLYANMYD